MLGGVVAFVLFLPNVLWQIESGWPSLEFYRNATVLKNLPSPPIKTLANQILFLNPVLFPIWSVGLVFLFTRDERNRVAGFAYVILLVILVVCNRADPTVSPDSTRHFSQPAPFGGKDFSHDTRTDSVGRSLVLSSPVAWR